MTTARLDRAASANKRKELQVSITQNKGGKGESPFPRTWNFKTEGTLEGRHRELRAVKAPDYNTGELIDKVVWESEHAKTGETVSVWLDNKVLFNAFADQVKARKQKAKTLELGELITITPLGLVQPKTSSGKPHNAYDVIFEHGVPPVTAEELLLGGSDGGTAKEEPDPPTSGGQLGTDDDLPF